MRRPPGAATLALLRRLRDAVPNLTLRTTFISGFPAETEAEHRELAALAEELHFERGGAFAYSQEEGTSAASLPDQLPESVKEARRDELSAFFQRQAAAWAEAQVGREIKVIVDTTDGADAIGRTLCFFKIFPNFWLIFGEL